MKFQEVGMKDLAGILDVSEEVKRFEERWVLFLVFSDIFNFHYF